jgi:hypothetical protein
LKESCSVVSLDLKTCFPSKLCSIISI